jgi:adenylate kinase family enzyme
MAKYLITGRQGSGKSTVIRALAQKGFIAFDTDALDTVTKLQDKLTGQIIDWPEGGAVDWDKYVWNWQEHELRALLAESETVFVGAVVSNQEKFYPPFDKIFVLIIDPESLIKRLELHEHTRTPAVKERLLANHLVKQQRLIDQGGIPIDGSNDVQQVIKDIQQAL